jgi:transcriptional regulator with XRE-family HTH domain
VIDQRNLHAVAARIARILREAREERGLSMNAVAERSGLSQPMVSLVERELRNPTIDTLLRLTSALELDLADVVAKAQREVSRKKSK